MGARGRWQDRENLQMLHNACVREHGYSPGYVLHALRLCIYETSHKIAQNGM